MEQVGNGEPDDSTKSDAETSKTFTPAETDLILTKVFQYLTVPDLKICAEVCQKWQHIFITKVGMPVIFIGKKSNLWQLPLVPEIEPPEITQKIAVQCLVVTNLSQSPEEVFDIKYGHVVKSVMIDGKILPATFTKVLVNSSLKNLVDFSLDWTTLNLLSLRKITMDFFPSIKVLTIRTLQNLEATIQCITNWEMARDNIHVLLAQDYRHLTKLYMTFLPVFQNGPTLVLTLVYFIKKHKETLKKLICDFYGVEIAENALFSPSSMLPPDPMLEIQRANEDANILKVEGSQLIANCNGIKLTHGFIRTDNTCRDIPGMNVLNQIVLNSTSLISAYLNTGSYPIFPVLTFRNNCIKLTSVEMDISLFDGFVDCEDFKVCTNLKVLSLIGQKRNNKVQNGSSSSSESSSASELIETSSLPKSLQLLRLCRLKITTSNADYLILQLPNIVLIELQEIGTSKGLGISFQALNMAVYNQKIHKISLMKAINEDSFGPNPTSNNNDHVKTLGFIFVKDMLKGNPESHVGLMLTIENGLLQYVFGWDSILDLSEIFKFMGGDPKITFPSIPLNLDEFDDNDYDSESDEDDDDEEEATELNPEEEMLALEDNDDENEDDYDLDTEEDGEGDVPMDEDGDDNDYYDDDIGDGDGTMND